MPPAAGDALLIVDLQKDFLPGGALAVPRGDEVVRPLNAIAAGFAAAGLPIVATRDWHPPGHCSFHDRGGPWPPHCVAHEPGAAFADDLELPDEALVVNKATHADRDAYSGFQETGLGARLRALSVTRVVVGGLATDYCVLSTVLDALDEGFAVVVLADAVRAVDATPGDGDRALEKMRSAGVRLMRWSGEGRAA